MGIVIPHGLGQPVSIRLRSVGPEKFFTLDAVAVKIWFQSVSGLWDRRNGVMNVLPLCGRSFNPSPVCGTGEIFDPDVYKALIEVSIRLRSVGPEKCAASSSGAAAIRFQSVSGLWDRRNMLSQAKARSTWGFNPSPVCGTGEMNISGGATHTQKFQSVSGLWDRRNLLPC